MTHFASDVLRGLLLVTSSARIESISCRDTENISVATIVREIPPSGRPLVLLLLLAAAQPRATLGGQVLSRVTARLHAGSTVSCRLTLLLLLLLLPLLPRLLVPFFPLLLLLLVRSTMPGQFCAMPFQRVSRCSPRAMSAWLGKYSRACTASALSCADCPFLALFCRMSVLLRTAVAAAVMNLSKRGMRPVHNTTKYMGEEKRDGLGGEGRGEDTWGVMLAPRQSLCAKQFAAISASHLLHTAPT